MNTPINEKPQAMRQRQVFEHHPVIGFRYIPGIRARMPHEEGGGYLIEVNDSGFRCGHDFVTTKPDGLRRVLLFGDSFSAGDGVSNGKRFGDLLEQHVSDLEVYNYGLPGTGTDQQYLTYQLFAQGIEHDLMVISIFVENIRRVAAHYRFFNNENGDGVLYAKPYYELVQGNLLLKNVPVNKDPIPMEELDKAQSSFVDYGLPLKKIIHRMNRVGNGSLGTKMTRLLETWGIKETIQKGLNYQPLPEYDRPNHPAWLIMKAILQEWIKNSPRPVMLLLIPLPQHVEETASPKNYQARFRELAETTGCTVYDPLPEMLLLPLAVRKQLRYREGHFNNFGHGALAKMLAPMIEKNLE